VIDGLAYALLGGAREALLGIRVVLEEAVVDEIDSNGNAFFEATIDALAKVLRGEEEHLENRVCLDL
jgi:hypothetical protein